MTVLALVGLITLICIFIIGVGIKVYTNKVLNDMDGVGENVAIIRNARD